MKNLLKYGFCLTLVFFGLVVANYAGAFNFTQTLRYGMEGNTEVSELQKFLIEKGYLQGTPNGMIYQTTSDAIKKFQTANGLVADGVVGPRTRNVLNFLQGSASQGSDSGIASTSLNSLINVLFPKICEGNLCTSRNTGYSNITGKQYVVWSVDGLLDDSVSSSLRSGIADCSGSACVMSYTFPETHSCAKDRGHQNFSKENCI